MKTWHGFKRFMVVSATSLALVAPGGAQASLDWFLKIDGIKGESTDAQHKDEIVIEAFSWGAQRSAVTGAMRPRPCFSEMAFVKFADTATPLLLANTFSGMSIPKAVLMARRSGGDSQAFLTIELTNVLVSSVSHSGSTESLSEAFSLQFARARVSYRRQDESGKLGPAIETTITGQTC